MLATSHQHTPHSSRRGPVFFDLHLLLRPCSCPQAVPDPDTAQVLPIMLATKLLPEMEAQNEAHLEAHRASAGGASLEAQYSSLQVFRSPTIPVFCWKSLLHQGEIQYSSLQVAPLPSSSAKTWQMGRLRRRHKCVGSQKGSRTAVKVDMPTTAAKADMLRAAAKAGVPTTAAFRSVSCAACLSRER